MELKKSPKADLQNKKSLFGLFGLLVSILLAVGAFSVSKSEIKFNGVGIVGEVVEQQVVEITRPEEPPKPEIKKVTTPAAASNVLEVVDNSVKLDDNMDMFNTDANENTVIEIKAPGKKETILEEDVVVMRAEVMPKFQGGDLENYRLWVQKKVAYPAIAEQNNISGRVTVKCVVGRDGFIRQVIMLASPDPSLFEAVKETILKSPAWTPGMQNGRPVSVSIVFNVVFTTTN